MFERAGKAMGTANLQQEGAYSQPIDYAKSIQQSYKTAMEFGAVATKTKKENDDYLAKFPNGIEISKVDEKFRPELTKWLMQKREQYVNAQKIKAQGSDAEGYYKAVNDISLIEASYEKISQDLDGLASVRKSAVDRRKTGSNAKSMYGEQNLNFENLVSKDYVNKLGLHFGVDENGLYTDEILSTGPGGDIIPVHDLDVGTKYDSALEDALDDEINKVQEDATTKQPTWDIAGKNKTKNAIEDLSKNQQAVKNYIHQNEDLLNEYIAQQVGIGFAIDPVTGKENPAWTTFKERKDTSTVGDLDQYDTPKYSKEYGAALHRSKIENIDTEWFVKTAMASIENKFIQARNEWILKYGTNEQKKALEEKMEKKKQGVGSKYKKN